MQTHASPKHHTHTNAGEATLNHVSWPSF